MNFMVQFSAVLLILFAGEALTDDCSPVTCDKLCQHGFAKDESGCEICQCEEHPPNCPPVCRNECPHGRVHDENGCPTCQCQDVVIDPPDYIYH